ncbi:hypothetical protein [Pajaroellobacter abortibovis]|uniref:hypothetical protein n=1 Tax=Pajaroellobacter abortibovis TaxID=1882918 RepID=UPI0012EC9B10|nr:hypothetical protein [Pajaroellobacter abortibovis]
MALAQGCIRLAQQSQSDWKRSSYIIALDHIPLEALSGGAIGKAGAIDPQSEDWM